MAPGVHEPLVSNGTIVPVRILVIGGSYGGLSTISKLLSLVNKNKKLPEGQIVNRGIHVTLIDERDGFFHTIGAPLAHASAPYVNKAWKRYANIAALNRPNVTVLRGKATYFDSQNQVATYEDATLGATRKERYDYLVVATGLRRTWPICPEALVENGYRDDAHSYIAQIKNARLGVVVIGGGAVGIEMAAELAYTHPEISVTLIHSRSTLLSSETLPSEFKDRTLTYLHKTGVKVLLSTRVLSTTPFHDPDNSTQQIYTVNLSSGESMQANVVISAYLPHPANSTFIPVSALDRTGCVAITPTLAFPASLPNFSCHYAVGDVASWTGMKRVGNSIAMGSIVGHNIYQSILRSEDLDPESGKRPLLEFPKVDPMMGLVIGKYCVSYYKEGGLEHGAETLDKYFSDDLSLKGCWDAIGLDVFA